jgi:hypothetical protein
VFHGKVTSSKWYNASDPYREHSSIPTNPQFLGGYEWGVDEISMPEEIPSYLINASQNGGIYIECKYAYLKFQADGTVRIAAKNGGNAPKESDYVTYDLSTINGAIYIHNNSVKPVAKVEGTVNGEVTVASLGSIEITSDLVYADNPRSNPASDDMIGLVAEDDIVVTENIVDTDRAIQASVMTLNTAVADAKNFYVEDYNKERFGTLNLYGALIQYSRGAIGTEGDSTSDRTGYSANYTWDTRLEKKSPPYYPMLAILKKIAWWD